MPLGALKGLEFDQVYVAGMQAEAMPGPVPKAAPDVPIALGGGGLHPQLQRHLLYTAMTRARARRCCRGPRRVRTAPCAPRLHEDARAVLGAQSRP